MLEKGFCLMLDLADGGRIAEDIDGVTENLEHLWRFDISRRLLQIWAEKHPLTATLHDSLVPTRSQGLETTTPPSATSARP